MNPNDNQEKRENEVFALQPDQLENVTGGQALFNPIIKLTEQQGDPSSQTPPIIPIVGRLG